MAGDISEKQKQILEYIKTEILKRGYPPSVREICTAVRLKSTSSVHAHLSTLEEKGYIRRDPTKPRAIEIIDDEYALSRREMVNVPIIGTVTAGLPILAHENIEDYLEYLSLYKKYKTEPGENLEELEAVEVMNEERGKSRKLASLRSLSKKSQLEPLTSIHT